MAGPFRLCAQNRTTLKLRRLLASTILFTVFACGCVLPPQIEPIDSNHAPSGTLEMLLDVQVDTWNNIQAAFATFQACFAGFPRGSSLTSAHVNAGALGSGGPIVIDLGLEPEEVMFPEGTGSFTITVPISSTLASQIISNTSAFYFQVDTARMSGALQGQFARVVITYSSTPDNKRIKRFQSPTSGDLF